MLYQMTLMSGDALPSGTQHVEVAVVVPGGEPAGRRNVSINVNFNAKKVLMYKFSATYQFAVSEVEFINSTRKLANTHLFSAAIFQS